MSKQISSKKAVPKPLPKIPRQKQSDAMHSMIIAPAAKGVTTTIMPPTITRGAKSFRVAHRELVLSSVAGSTGFTVQNFLKINPGLSATFPWLPPQAAQWEQYHCHKCDIVWVPIAPTSTQGDVILSPNYDASDPQPTTEAQAANNFGTVIGPCWNPFVLRMDVAAMMGLGPRRFVRQSAVAGDVKTFDVGTVSVCSNNETGTSAIGKVFIDYDFEFFIPQNDPSTATAPLYTSMFTRATSNQSFATGTGAAINWNNLVYDPLGIGAGSSGVFTPPAGCYRIEASVYVSDSSNEQFTALMVLYKNGATLSSPIEVGGVFAGTAAGPQVTLTLIGVLPCNGTDTFQIQLTLTGAAGTLVVESGAATLVVSLA